jgi:DsbC/DsbD-like thiol-disulfide interchange protein
MKPVPDMPPFLPGLTRRSLLGGLALLAMPAPGRAGPWSAGRDAHASAWAKGHQSAVRLLAGPRLANGDWLAGLEMQLGPGFKTYWRDPGDAGVPPVFNWDGSRGIGSVAVLWPAPTRFFDASGHSNGYVKGPLFPLRIKAEEAGPRHLALQLDYAVCEKLCIPVQAGLTLDWPAPDAGSSPHVARIREAMARVPRMASPGEQGPLAVHSAQMRREPAVPGGLVLAVIVRSTTPPELFVEAPSPWIWGLPQRGPAGQAPDGMCLFEVPCLERAAGAGSLDLVLTVATPGDATETRARVSVEA